MTKTTLLETVNDVNDTLVDAETLINYGLTMPASSEKQNAAFFGAHDGITIARKNLSVIDPATPGYTEAMLKVHELAGRLITEAFASA